MMGFHFPKTSIQPYSSKNISEILAQGGHITCVLFMRDYLYIPLGGNRMTSKSADFTLIYG